MKGVVFNILEEFVEANLGKEGVAHVRKELSLKPFMAIANYPDEMVGQIVMVGSRATGLAPEDLVYAFGRFFANSPTLHKVYGQYFAAHKTAREMLLFTDELHERLTRSMPGATPPRFRYEQPAPDQLVMKYASKRNLCTLLRGIIHGVGDFYKEEVKVVETQCMKKGAAECSIHITFAKVSADRNTFARSTN